MEGRKWFLTPMPRIDFRDGVYHDFEDAQDRRCLCIRLVARVCCFRDAGRLIMKTMKEIDEMYMPILRDMFSSKPRVVDVTGVWDPIVDRWALDIENIPNARNAFLTHMDSVYVRYVQRGASVEDSIREAITATFLAFTGDKKNAWSAVAFQFVRDVIKF